MSKGRKETDAKPSLSEGRRFWVVSPNVRNHDPSVPDWRQASIREEAAFMGWGATDFGHGGIGPRFAGKAEKGVQTDDIILIARRYQHKPQIVGFGVVKGNAASGRLKLALPDKFELSMRRLSPFKAWSGPPANIPIIDCLRHTKALVQLHPEWNNSHHKVCIWMESELGDSVKSAQKPLRPNPPKPTKGAKIVDHPGSHQLDYMVQTKAKVGIARKHEAELVGEYSRWLKLQGRRLDAARYGNLMCDGYEAGRNNLIEAKCSTSREHIRMAVGQLLDYAFQGQSKLGSCNMAILLPSKPEPSMVNWLLPLGIHVIWRDGVKFFDDADAMFT